MEEQVGPAFRLEDYIRTYKLRTHVTSRGAQRLRREKDSAAESRARGHTTWPAESQHSGCLRCDLRRKAGSNMIQTSATTDPVYSNARTRGSWAAWYHLHGKKVVDALALRQLLETGKGPDSKRAEIH